jgi:hypothetical protein
LDFERALIALRRILEKPNPKMLAKIVATPYVEPEYKDPSWSWLKMMYKYLPPDQQRNWWYSMLELLASTEPPYPEGSTQADRLFRRAYSWCIGNTIEKAQSKRVDPLALNALSIVYSYFKKRGERSKQPTEAFVDFLFRFDPELGLQVMCFAADQPHEAVRILDIMVEPYRTEIDHVTHFVQTASRRIKMQRAQKRDIELAQARLRWLLHNCPDWWAKRYILEILLRDPELRGQALLEALRTEKHPWVTKRLPELEKKLREHKDTLPLPR